MIPKSEQDFLDSFSFKIPKLSVSEEKWDDYWFLDYSEDWGKDAQLVGYAVKDNHIIKLRIIGQDLDFLPENIGTIPCSL